MRATPGVAVVRFGDLFACLAPTGSTNCTTGANPRAWARVRVGGLHTGVQFWSYYNSP
jgi:hypothetical protein